VNHLSRYVARVGRGQEHDTGGNLYRLLEKGIVYTISEHLRWSQDEYLLTPGLPMVVVTPNDSIDSLPMVATTKGVRIGPGHYEVNSNELS
jgi:hypothetical protein